MKHTTGMMLLLLWHMISGYAPLWAGTDSLQLKLNAASTDAERAAVYVDLISDNRLDTAIVFRYMESALQAVEKTKTPADDAELHLDLGVTYWRAAEFTSAVQEHNIALKLFTGLQDKKGIAEATMALGQDHIELGDFPKATALIESTLGAWEQQKDYKKLGRAYELISYIAGAQGNVVKTVENRLLSLKYYDLAGEDMGVAIGYASLADNYDQMEDYARALQYAKLSAEKLEKLDTINTAFAYANIGSIYLKMNDTASALKYMQRSLQLGKTIRDPGVVGGAYTYLGKYYLMQANYTKALQHYLAAADALHNSAFNLVNQAEVYLQISQCYIRLQQLAPARQYLDSVWALTAVVDSRYVNHGLYAVQHQMDSIDGDWKNAYDHYKLYVQYNDSLENISDAKRVIASQMQYEFDKKEAIARAEQEKKDLRQRLIRNAILAGLIGALVFLIIVARQRNRINTERKTSESLLLNILPEDVAAELKTSGSAKARHFDEVTVMFTDFKNFTQASEQLSPEELVAEIHFCYSAFDRIITKHGLEKIKTIGDSYMCAGGLSADAAQSATHAVQAALEMSAFMTAEAEARRQSGKLFFELRIGLHTGPVVAGIVGIKKFAYDIWGDTVNIASRMESSGEPGRVNISGDTYERVKDQFHCIPRGKILAKNKGEIDMYFVEPESPVNL